MDIYNCVIVDTTELKRIFYNNSFNPFTMHDYRVDHCLLSKPNCLFDTGSVCGPHMLYDVDPKFLSNSFVPDPCSPLVNAGSNFWPDTFNITTDLLQNARIFFDTVDIGAYEVTQSCISGLEVEPHDLPQAFSLLQNPLHSGQYITILCQKSDIVTVNIDIFNSLGEKVSNSCRIKNTEGQVLIPGLLWPGIYFFHVHSGLHHQILKLIVTE